MNSKRDILILSRYTFAALFLTNIGLALALSFNSNLRITSIKEIEFIGVPSGIEIGDVLTLLQLFLGAFTLDQLMRRVFVSINRAANLNVIPLFNIQLASVFIYILTALASYLFIFDHPIDSLLAASGMVSLAIGYLSKDLIQDVLTSIQIQSDGLVSLKDWVQLSKMGEGQIYQIVDFDYCMVTLRNVNGYQQMIRNRIFYENRILNLSRQEIGSKRAAEISVDSQFSEQVVLSVLNQVVPFVRADHQSIFPKYFCRLQDVSPYRLSFMIDYSCAPDINPTESDHWIKHASVRFLRCAGMIEITGDASRTYQEYEEKRTDFLTISSQQLLVRLVGASQYSFLRALSYEELQTLSSLVRLVQFDQGKQILRSGEIGNSMYLVSEGSLRVQPKEDSKKQSPFVRLWPGDCVGEMTVLTGAERTADVYAETNVRLIEIASNDIAILIDRNTSLAEALAELITQRQKSNAELPSQLLSASETRKSLRDKIITFLRRKV